MKRIILTGGTGFIGKNLLESFLCDKYELLAPTRKEMDLMDEVSVRKYMMDHPSDVLIHSAIKPANRAAADLSRIMADNSRMFFNIYRNRDYFGKLLHLGSGSSYDIRFYQPKMRETDFDRHVPIDELGLYKYLIGKMGENDPKIIDLRIFGIYGKYEDYSIRFISNMICKVLYKLPLTMNQDKFFDYIFVDDLPQILDYFIEHDVKYSAYNVTPDSSILLSSIANLIMSMGKYESSIIIKDPTLGKEYSGDNARLKSEIKNLKLTTIEQGVSELFSYYSTNLEVVERSKLLVDR